jgi:hypothetical protein
MYMKRLFLTVIGLCSFVFCLAQEEDSSYVRKEKKPEETVVEKDEDENDPDLKYYTGANLSLQFGNSSFVDFSPLVGYRITETFSVGVGGTYQYLSYRVYSSSGNASRFSTNTYGARIFSRLVIYKNVFVHGEYENLNVDVYNSLTGQLNREWVPGLLFGGGFMQQAGERVAYNLTILYNFKDSVKSPYGSPLVFRAGFLYFFGIGSKKNGSK